VCASLPFPLTPTPQEKIVCHFPRYSSLQLCTIATKTLQFVSPVNILPKYMWSLPQYTWSLPSTCTKHYTSLTDSCLHVTTGVNNCSIAASQANVQVADKHVPKHFGFPKRVSALLNFPSSVPNASSHMTLITCQDQADHYLNILYNVKK